MRKSAPAPDGSGRRTGGAPTGEGGVIGAATVLLVPAMVASMMAVVCMGQVLYCRQMAYRAADLAALAAVQSLDLGALAEGVVRIVPEEASTVASGYARANLPDLSRGTGSDLQVEIEVLNPDPQGKHDPVTGQLHGYATVCVRLRFTVPLRLGPLAWRQSIAAHADASVVPR